MTNTHSYPPNKFAFPDPPQVAPVRAPRPSSAHSGRALPDNGGPGDAPEAVAAEAVRPQTSEDTEAGRSILHLNIQARPE